MESQSQKETTAADTQGSETRVVIFSLNPNSGSSDRRALCEQIANRLRKDGFEVQLLTNLEQVQARTEQALSDDRLRAVVSAGGDGTIAMLANRLPSQTPFAILPLGTENLLGKHLGLKADVEFCTNLITDGQTIEIDAGRANGKLFLVVASCGFDAAVVKRLDEVRTGHINRLTWIRPILHTMRRYTFPGLRIVADGKELPDEARWSFVFNIPKYAIGLEFTPQADIGDGLLDLCTYRDGGIFRGIWYLLNTFIGRHRNLDATQFRQFRQLTITSDTPTAYELDGDPGGMLPLEIEVCPGAVKLLVPKTTTS